MRVCPAQVWLWSAAFGILTAFHILCMLDAILTMTQPDIRVYGRFFSYWFILVVNLLFTLLALVAIGHVTVADLARRFIH